MRILALLETEERILNLCLMPQNAARAVITFPGLNALELFCNSLFINSIIISTANSKNR